MKRLLPLILSLSLLCGCAQSGPGNSPPADQSTIITPQTPSAPYTSRFDSETLVHLSNDGITSEGEHSVLLSHDIVYYEDRETYESGLPYGEGESNERHSAAEAEAHTVVTITEPGAYRITGSLSAGQILVDLGEDAYSDPNAVVELILDNVDITCTVAPAILFLNVYECDGAWSADTASPTVDTTDAGAVLLLADGSQNRVTGSHVAKIYKDKEGEKKLWKQDGALYSYMSMNICGSGTLDLTADNEGIGSELHLTINGGNINIRSQDDGINTNEDGVSVTTFNAGCVHIIAGLGAEGDGVDSNGYLVINGGTVVSSANPGADAGLDSDLGSYVNGGIVIALGSTMDWAESESEQVTMNLQFAEYKEKGSSIIVTKEDGSVVFAYDSSKDTISGENTREFMGAVISCPNFAVGESYNVYIGSYSENSDSIEGSHTNGIYDISTITAVHAVQQAYSSTEVRKHGGKPPKADGNRPAMPNGTAPQAPDDIPQAQQPYFTQFPDNMQPPPFPEGDSFDPEIMKPVPEGFEKPTDENGNPIGFGGEGEFDFNGEKAPHTEGEKPQINTPEHNDVLKLRTEFYMQDKVNSFSGVADYIL